MSIPEIPQNPYVLLTPGPLSTTAAVKAAMLRDWSTWDDDYNGIVQDIRRQLVELATARDGYTSVLMQGSGTFCVEAALGTAIPPRGRILIVANGAYGDRMALIAERLRVPHVHLRFDETQRPDPVRIRQALDADGSISHLAVVHCETTTGILNPLEEVAELVRGRRLRFIVDAMSSFGGIPLDVGSLGVDFLISSANKCIQGVPGFGFVIARRGALEECKGLARSVSLDLYSQWKTMETEKGKWRFTSPTHVVHAFAAALEELHAEGGVTARYRRYCENHSELVRGMSRLGFSCLLDPAVRSPIITSFLEPSASGYSFPLFYESLKKHGFVIYPGKVTNADTFRIGTIGDVYPATIRSLIEAVRLSMTW